MLQLEHIIFKQQGVSLKDKEALTDSFISYWEKELNTRVDRLLFTESESYCGMSHPEIKTIKISRRTIKRLDIFSLFYLALHEVAHQKVYDMEDGLLGFLGEHGPLWKRMMNKHMPNWKEIDRRHDDCIMFYKKTRQEWREDMLKNKQKAKELLISYVGSKEKLLKVIGDDITDLVRKVADANHIDNCDSLFDAFKEIKEES